MVADREFATKALRTSIVPIKIFMFLADFCRLEFAIELASRAMCLLFIHLLDSKI